MRKLKILDHIEHKKKFKSIINKNELTVLIIASMLVTAGYLDYLGKIKTEEVGSEIEEITYTQQEEIADIGDATLVSSNISNDLNEENLNDLLKEKNEESEENNNSYFISSKLDRSRMYSQIIENYQKIIENVNVSEEQKAIATQEISNINKLQNAIMISENLLLTKGFENCIIFANNQSISVVVGKDDLKQEELAQIQNIVSRELNVSIENIHISTK